MLLSIGMMVKNESKHLEECLKSLQPILNNIESELVIIDTGSEDDTVEIAKRYTDKVYFEKWDNDFSGMRNKVISYCKGKWLMVIDGDEVIDSNEEIISFFTGKEYLNYKSATMVGKNLKNENDKLAFSTMDTFRFFKNDKDFRYDGTVHNQPNWKGPIKVLRSSLLHYGYVVDDKELMERKFKRTSAILLKELENEPNNLYYRFQISVTYGMHGELNKALDEAKRAYDTLISINSDKDNYRYIYMQYACMLINNAKYYECEKIALEGINISAENTVDKIDLYFYLAKSQTMLGKTEQAIKNYSLYLELLEMYETKKIILDISIINYTLQYKEEAYQELVKIYLKEENWKAIRKILNELNREDIIVSLYQVIFKCFKELSDYQGLLYYYKEKIQAIDKNNGNKFIIFMEKDKLNMSKEECLNIEKEFSNLEDSYGELNKIRIEFNEENKGLNISSSILKRIEKNEVEFFYGDLIYFKVLLDEDINIILENTNYNFIKECFVYIYNKYDDFSEKLLKHIKKNNNKKTDEFKNIRLIKVYLRYLLVVDKLSDENFEYAFNLYIQYGIEYIKKIYSMYLLENELVNECRNSEDVFHIYILKALENKKTEKIKYVKYLKMALKEDESMSKGIQILLDKTEEKSEAENEMEILKGQFKSNIENLIINNNLSEAKDLIQEYEDILGSDLEILMLKSKLLVKKKYIN